MFDRTLNSPWDERSRRGLTTLTSFSLQALAVVVLLVVPLLRPQGLPSFRQLSTPISWGQPLESPPAPRTHGKRKRYSPEHSGGHYLQNASANSKRHSGGWR